MALVSGVRGSGRSDAWSVGRHFLRDAVGVLGLTGFGVLAGATVSTAGVLASSDGADVEPEIEQDPGPGYEWSTSDACVGTWAADSDADGGESSWAKLAMHVLGHIMGAVQDSAPRHDTQNPGHPSDAYDRMAYGPGTTIVCSQQWRDARYDCNSNDYFDTSPGSGYLSDHWNIADNGFLVNS
jgi:hypothetical protein